MMEIRKYILLFVIYTMVSPGRSDQSKIIIRGVNKFGLRLVSRLSHNPNGAMISTLGVSTTLTALRYVSSGKTAAEIEEAFGYSDNSQTPNLVTSTFHDILSSLHSNRAGYVLQNILVLPLVVPPFESLLRNQFSIEPRIENFQSNIAVSSNLDFNAVWKYQFNVSKTKVEPFFFNNGRKAVYVNMMFIKAYLAYSEHNSLNAKILEIPFAGDDITMVVLLPNDMDGAQNQLQRLSYEDLEYSLYGLLTIGIHLRIPRFSITSSLPLEKAISNVGIKSIFLPNEAEIGNTRNTYVSDVFHKASIKITENGELPTPVTTISDGMASNNFDFPTHDFFTVDHPFTFIIRHKPSRMILSIGQVTEPTQLETVNTFWNALYYYGK